MVVATTNAVISGSDTSTGTFSEEHLGSAGDSQSAHNARTIPLLLTIPQQSVEDWFSAVISDLCHSNYTTATTRTTPTVDTIQSTTIDVSGNGNSGNSGNIGSSGSGDNSGSVTGVTGEANGSTNMEPDDTAPLPTSVTMCFLVSRQQTVLAVHREMDAGNSTAWYVFFLFCGCVHLCLQIRFRQ